MVVAMTVYLGACILLIFAHVREFLRNVLYRSHTRKGYAPLKDGYDDFYTRRMFKRIQDCWNRPISSAPAAWFDVMLRKRVWPKDRESPIMVLDGGKTRRCLNLASYNYLGFAAQDEYCTPKVIEGVKQQGPSMCCSRVEGGTTPVHLELERRVPQPPCRSPPCMAG